MDGSGPPKIECAAPQARKAPMGEVALYFLRLGLLGFGGPVALVGQMEHELVSDRIGEAKTATDSAAATVSNSFITSSPIFLPHRRVPMRPGHPEIDAGDASGGEDKHLPAAGFHI